VGLKPLLPLGRVVAHQIVDLACKPLFGRKRSVGIGPLEVEGKRLAATPFALGKGEGSPLMGKEEAVAGALGIVGHRFLCLALVGDKGERELPVGVEGLFLAHALRRRLRLGGDRRPRCP
jgi:hypothetical protein